MTQHVEGENGVGRLGVLHNNLRQGQPGQIFAGSGVDHAHVMAIAHQLRNLVLVDVLAGQGIVKTAVLVLLDDEGLGNIFFILWLTRGQRRVRLIYVALQHKLQHKS